MKLKDPKKEAYVRYASARYNNADTISWTYIVAGGFLVLAFSFVTIKQGSQPSFQASVLHATSTQTVEKHDEAIRSVRELVGWYDTGEWQALDSPAGLGTAVVMSEDFIWYVAEDGTVYNVNGLAASITSGLTYASDVKPQDVLSVIRKSATK